MALLPHPIILDIHQAAVNAGIAPSRSVLLAGVAPAIVANLPSAGTPSAQLLGDLDELNRMHRLVDGTVPLELWLANAERVAGTGSEADVFRRAIDALPERSVESGLLRRKVYPRVLGDDLVRRAAYESNDGADFDRRTAALVSRRVRHIQIFLAGVNLVIWAAARVALALFGASTVVVLSFGIAALVTILVAGVVLGAAKTALAALTAKGGIAGALNLFGLKLGSTAGGQSTVFWGPLGLASGVGLATGTVAVPTALALRCHQQQDIQTCEVSCVDGKGDARSCYYLGRAYGNIAFVKSWEGKANVDVEVDGVVLPANLRQAIRYLLPLCVASREPFQQEACAALADTTSYEIGDAGAHGESERGKARYSLSRRSDADRGEAMLSKLRELACRDGKNPHACVLFGLSHQDGRRGYEMLEGACDAADPYGCLEAASSTLLRQGDRAKGLQLFERARTLFGEQCNQRCVAGGNPNDTNRGRDCWWASVLWDVKGACDRAELSFSNNVCEALQIDGGPAPMPSSDPTRAAEYRHRGCDICGYRRCKPINSWTYW